MQTLSDAILARYLAGECDPDEARDVERWAGEDPAHAARLAELRAIWEARRPARAWNVDEIWTNVRRTAVQGTGRARRVTFGHTPVWETASRWRGLRAGLAAAVMLLVAGGSFVFINKLDNPLATAPAAAMREYVTPRGQRATLQLPDGTRLVLAPASRLRIPATFGQPAREVFLDGEALFEVAHDSTRPFRVHARDAVTEVLGTRFDVRAYADDSTVSVAVAEGAVALGRAAPAVDSGMMTGAPQGVVLAAGELGSLGPGGRVTTARGAALSQYLDWATGRLVFTDTPLHEVATRLGRWYDIEVRLSSPGLASRRFSATFTNESPDEAVEFVAAVLDLGVTSVDSTYTLRKQ